MAALPEKARVVIIGQGGIVGASVAHHLVQNGWDDIVGLEKSAIPTDIGSTSHASDFCYMTSHDKLNVFTICVQSPLKQYVRTGFKAFMKSSRSANGVTEYDADADARAFKAYAAEALAQERSATTPPSRR